MMFFFQNVLWRQLVETREEDAALSLFNTRVKTIQNALQMIMANPGVELQKIARIGESAWQVQYFFFHALLIQIVQISQLLNK